MVIGERGGHPFGYNPVMTRPRITFGRLLLAVAAMVVLYGMLQLLSLVLEARRNTLIRRHRETRRELTNHRDEYPPGYYEQRMRELDAEAVELGMAK